MYSPTVQTRARIVAAAERAFAEKGLDRVPLSYINSKAGQGNKSALQYHFKNRAGLLAAIAEKHRETIDRERRALLDALEDGGRADLRAVVEALVLPLASKLDDADGGVYYLRLMAQDRERPKREFSREDPIRPETKRLMKHVDEVSRSLPARDARARTILVFGLLFHSLADFSRQYPVKRRPKHYAADRDAFVRALTDALVAILRNS